MDYRREAERTRPDYIVYVPKSVERTPGGDTGNEHFLVEPLPERFGGGPEGLFAVWTQSSYEGAADQRIVFARSLDGGQTWSAPKTIAGGDDARGLGMASWAFPLVSKSGRIYVLFNRHIGVNDIFTHTTGRMACIVSDDGGETWSDQTLLPMPKSRCWDNPDPDVPANWIVWQKPVRLRSSGKHFTGFTRWVSPAVRPPKPRREWWAEAAVVEFMRFENVDADPEPQNLRITFLSGEDDALQTGLIGHPDVPAIQEPSWVELPDGRLFCVMRTTLGSPYWSVSGDGGETWSRPEPLRRFDDGPALPHPMSPCPIYPLDDNGNAFALLYHNHDGHFGLYTPAETTFHRRPVCLARGAFRPGAHQPVWFSEPWYFLDHGGVPLLRLDLAMYASVTREGPDTVLWYPDRKFFLLGRRISADLVQSLSVPERR